MAKFLTLALGGCARGLLVTEAALGVRPRCVQAPDEVSISLKPVNTDYKWKCGWRSEVISPNLPTCVGHCPRTLDIKFIQTMGLHIPRGMREHLDLICLACTGPAMLFPAIPAPPCNWPRQNSLDRSFSDLVDFLLGN